MTAVRNLHLSDTVIGIPSFKKVDFIIGLWFFVTVDILVCQSRQLWVFPITLLLALVHLDMHQTRALPLEDLNGIEVLFTI